MKVIYRVRNHPLRKQAMHVGVIHMTKSLVPPFNSRIRIFPIADNCCQRLATGLSASGDQLEQTVSDFMRSCDHSHFLLVCLLPVPYDTVMSGKFSPQTHFSHSWYRQQVDSKVRDILDVCEAG